MILSLHGKGLHGKCKTGALQILHGEQGLLERLVDVSHKRGEGVGIYW